MKKVFDEVKIADFSWIYTGPFLTRYFADHGAEVIRIESSKRPELLRSIPPYKDNIPGINRTGYFANANCNKYGITLNLAHPKGVEIAKKLVKWADVVVESFSPGTMKKLGLDYEELKKVKPDIIMLSATMIGQIGPYAKMHGTGAHLSALSGFVDLTGWPDRDPAALFGAYTDVIGPRLGGVLVAAALDYRRRTGKGQYIDLSQHEASLIFLAPLLLDYNINGRIAERKGNRSDRAAPHGAYRCKGEDRWCAIAVFSDEEWKAMCKVMGNPPSIMSLKFNNILGRKENEDELDQIVEQWTINYEPQDVMTKLQQAGVSAGVLYTAEDLHNDPQLKFRHHYWVLDHLEMGACTYDGPGFNLSKTPAELYRAAPCLGQNNYYVYTQILGHSDEEFIKNLEQGVYD